MNFTAVLMYIDYADIAGSSSAGEGCQTKVGRRKQAILLQENKLDYDLQLYIIGQLPEQNVLHLQFSIFC